MNIWHQQPFVRIILPFTGGIAAGATSCPGISMILPFAFLFFACFIVMLFLLNFRNYNQRWIPGTVINLLLVLAGMILVLGNSSFKKPSAGTIRSGENNNIIAQISESFQERQKSFRTVAKIKGFFSSGQITASYGKIILYFEKQPGSILPKVGEILVFRAVIDTIGPPANPGEFNLSKYLGGKGIYHRSFLKEGQWEIIDRPGGFNLQKSALNIRDYFIRILAGNHLEGREFAVAAAILFGMDDGIDEDLMHDYTGTGVVHILCVSGLHVGILAFLFSFMLGFTGSGFRGRMIRLILVVFLIWIYSLLTGLTPSILRAAVMFTILYAGQVFSRETNIYNTLAASAFILLVCDPNHLTDVGFQLSYLAVLGIISIYPTINSFITPRGYLPEKIWQLAAVSIAAQIMTVPLTLFYFHQFPNYFLISNLFAVPMSGLILYTGIFLLFSSPVPFLANFTGKILSGLIRLMNEGIGFLENIPGSVTENICITHLEMWLLYMIIISMMLLIRRTRPVFLLFLLAFTIILAFSFTKRKHQNLIREEITVFHLMRSTGIEFVSGRNAVLVADSSVLNNERMVAWSMKNHQTRLSLREVVPVWYKDKYRNGFIDIQSQIIDFKGLRFVIVDMENDLFRSDRKLSADYLVVIRDSRVTIEQLQQRFDFGAVIIDASCSRRYSLRMKTECEISGVPCHVVSESGALTIKQAAQK